jgi:hypothetical protein
VFRRILTSISNIPLPTPASPKLPLFLQVFSPWWWRQYAFLKRRPLSTGLHGTTTQQTAVFILAAVRTWNFTAANSVSVAPCHRDRRQCLRGVPRRSYIRECPAQTPRDGHLTLFSMTVLAAVITGTLSSLQLQTLRHLVQNSNIARPAPIHGPPFQWLLQKPIPLRILHVQVLHRFVTAC